MTLWPFAVEQDPVETLEWRTCVIRCRNTEQRIAKRECPRQEFLYEHHLDGVEYLRARQLARELAGGTSFDLPVWNERTAVGNVTAGAVTLAVDATGKCFKAGGKLAVWSSPTDYEVCTIYSIGTGTITVNPAVVSAHTLALVMPVRVATMPQEPDFYLSSKAGFVRAKARFEVVVTEDLSNEVGWAYPVYLGDHVLTSGISVRGEVTERHVRQVAVLDSEVGSVYRAPVLTSASKTAIVAWSVTGYAQLWDLRVWLHKRKGMWTRFWLPSFYTDLAVAADIDAADTTITIADIDYGSLYSGHNHFWLFAADGNMYGFEVTGHSSGAPGYEVLTLSAPFGADVVLANISKVSQLAPVRFNADRLDIQHKAAGQAFVSVPVVEVPL